ncbi:MAG: hypothetical protein H8E22_03835 [Candidatus Cloacimonetes bacterium]|nr:hypothetical protein [Candidatus Cloacimonadota bacterium]
MGKAILVISVLLLAVVVGIVISSGKSGDDVPEIITDDIAQIQARSLSNYALQYGIRQLLKGNVTFIDSTRGTINNFVPLDVLDGTIDSIIYAPTTDGTIRVDSYVSYIELESQVSHHGYARFGFFTDEGLVLNITAAIVTGGSITVKAKAVISGIVVEDSTFDFAGVFGMTEQEFKDECISRGSYIETPANNEPMPDSLTWMNNDLRIQSFWSGSGILVVNGDFNSTAHIDFDGILVVFGELLVGAQSDITGAVYVIGDATVGAHATISFDADAISDAFDALPIDISLEIAEWNEG